MLQRNLLYTGITRGKTLVVLVGSRKALSAAVRRRDAARRCSALSRRLREMAEGQALPRGPRPNDTTDGQQ